MSQLLDFYRGEGTDAEGRSLHELWSWSNDELEQVHDFIQWMFPLREPSRFNPDAPLLTAADVAAFRSDAFLRSRLTKSFKRILVFLGLSLAEDGTVVEGPNFAERVPEISGRAQSQLAADHPHPQKPHRARSRKRSPSALRPTRGPVHQTPLPDHGRHVSVLERGDRRTSRGMRRRSKVGD